MNPDQLPRAGLYVNDPARPLPERIECAAEGFLLKFGRAAQVAHVSPYDGYPGEHPGLTVTQTNAVLPGTVWIGRA